jgi:hypothetical protein
MSKRAFVARCGVALLMVIGPSACGGGGNEVVARVGSTAITAAVLDHWTTVEATISPATGPAHAGSPRYATLKQRTLGFLISSERTIGEADELGIRSTEKEVQEALRLFDFERNYGGRRSQDTELQRLFSAKPDTQADRAWIVKVRLLAEKIVQRQLSQAERAIMHAEIVSYYANHMKRFLLPERRDVAVIETFRRAKSEEARREIEAGRSLLGVVELRNDEPAVGGFKAGLSRRSLRHAYEENYFAAKPHVLVGPLKAEIYYLFEVTAVLPPRQRTLGEVQASIRRQLVSARELGVLTKLVRVLDRKWKANTRCRAAYAVEQCGSRLG